MVLVIKIGPATFPVEFQVIDIPLSFNLLLRKAWLHEVEAFPSFLHQKIKILYKGEIIVIEGDPERTLIPKDSPVLGISS